MAETKKAQSTTQKRSFEGTVVSIAGMKTLTVRVDTTKMHQKYRKQYVSSKKYAVHDEKGSAQVGDVVAFVECRPLSKRKRWTIKSIVKKAV